MSPSDLDLEQEHLTGLYGRLDELRLATKQRLVDVAGQTGGTAQARSERDATFTEYSARLSRLDAAEQGLCFGRLDLEDGVRHYVGRVGLPAPDADADPLLLDWRAPAARPFYVATSAAPEGVHRRRHIATRERRVTSLDDEVLDGAPDADREQLAGAAALLAAVTTGRTGRMQDIVATLQAEQDRIIRSDAQGVLVVQGGPGTGKTAVALHRAAYLLYHSNRIATRGVLVVGPNAVFLRYIGQVLPGLGETSVLLSTVGELFPGVVADRVDAPATVALKGSRRMADLVAAAVRDRQAPDGPAFDVRVGDDVVRLEPRFWTAAADRARATRRPHNQARPTFVRLVTAEVARQLEAQAAGLADRLEAEAATLLGDTDLDAAAAADLARLGYDEADTGDAYGETAVDYRAVAEADPNVADACDRLWPPMTPGRLLAELFAHADRLETAAAGLLTPEEIALLRREPGRPGYPGGWSVADVPLLDEAAQRLGADDRAARAQAARARDEEIAYAQGVLDVAVGSKTEDKEVLTVGDLLDARRLAERHRTLDGRTVAERAAVDRTWTFGHVIVDEAQELSPMAWRLLMRRCPTRSMTLVGDIAQTSSPAGLRSWDEALTPYVGDRWRLTRLSVNYRTPAEIMRITEPLLATLDADAEPPSSVRETGEPPWHAEVPPAALVSRVASVARAELAGLGDGRLAVITPDALAPAVAAALPEASAGPEPDLTERAVVLGAAQSKGLEFDVVLVVDPAGIIAAAPRGRNDLYVALTRATQRLGILHPGELPDELTRMPAGDVPSAAR
ncbi:HelD family protein [Cryptosporangium phraense]|uniref:Helicase n=1 Tax=Cryptosporangium phraense TaxID=2593070 RepID=A0A545AL07_9ACTN|nr:UvrD-helicase domain-containing protein [Cryptosporangium phraense]TQS41998.1 helicase [Cryptosporangium phraense]